MAPGGKKASKPVFKTTIPFTETKCPKTSATDQNIILDLVCNLIQPLGHHRTSHLPPSKGKKRKRKPPTNTNDNDTSIPDAPPPPPPIAEHLLIGLNSITRHLEELAAAYTPDILPPSSKPAAPQAEKDESDPSPSKEQNPPTQTQPANTVKTPTSLPKVAILLLPVPNPENSLPHAHLPTLLYLSSPPSLSTPSPTLSSAPRLILLPHSSETRLAAALGIPRVGALAVLENAPGSDILVNYCREKVGDVECAWIEEGMKAQWSGIKGSY